MKRRKYVAPAAETLHMEAESPLLSASDPQTFSIEKGEGTATGGEALSNKKHGIWDSDSWLQN